MDYYYNFGKRFAMQHPNVTVYDRKSSLVIETKDDSKNSSYEAIGLGAFSNSASTVSSYVTIFETLWKQSGMYETSQNQLHSAEEELDKILQMNICDAVLCIRSTRDKSVTRLQIDVTNSAAGQLCLC